MFNESDGFTNTGHIIENNIIYTTSVNCQFITDWNSSPSPYATFTSDYNCFYRDGVGTFSTNATYVNLAVWKAIGQDAHSISANPLFVSATDFHLQATSPCINKGVALTEVTNDFAGASRPRGATFDIGAYEYYSITPTTLTLTGVTAQDKVYDATTSATVNFNSAVLIGILGSDSVSLNASLASASFSTKNVGTDKAVTVSGLSLSGTDSANYTINATVLTTADITARPLTVSAAGADKVYDGGTSATVNLTDNRIAGDVLSASYASATFSDKNAGSEKTVSVGGISIAGTDSANYSFNTTASTTANITARPLTVTAATNSKVYDGTTASLGAPTITTGSLANGDSATWSESFTNKNVGNGNKTLVAAGTVSDGNSGNNYAVTFVNNMTGTITPTTLTLTGVTAQDKVYDATTSATVNFGSAALLGVLGTDSVSLNTSLASASFADKNVGTDKAVTVSELSLSGTDSANYTINTTVLTTADITARPLIVSAAGADKVYDGGLSATVTLSDNRIAGDVLSASYALATFSDKNAGSEKTVSVGGINIAGTDAGNYTLVNDTATTTADIVEPPTDPPVVDSPVIQPPVVKSPLLELSMVKPPAIELPVVKPFVVELPVIELPIIEPPVAEPSAVKHPDKSEISLSDPENDHKTLKTKDKVSTSTHSQNHLNKQRILRAMRPSDVKQPGKSETSLSHPWAGNKTQKIRGKINTSIDSRNSGILFKLKSLSNEQRILRAMHPFVLMVKLCLF